jgi:hypothetical protein
VAPAVTRVAVVFNPQTAPYAEALLRPIEAAGRTFVVMVAAAPAADAAIEDGSIPTTSKKNHRQSPRQPDESEGDE